MMRKVLFLINFVCILIFACNNSSKKNESVIVPEKDIRGSNEDIIYLADSDTITLNIVNGSATLKIYKKERQSILLRFNSLDYKKLEGKLFSADSMSNIRFSQIILPDGSMDGPFSRDILYDLPVKGDYMLSIHENQMAGNPWGGEVRVSISLNK